MAMSNPALEHQPPSWPSCRHASSDCLVGGGTCVLHFDLSLAADLDEVPAIVDFVDGLVMRMGAAPGHKSDVGLALHEALINAVDHGCQRDGSQTIQVSLCCLETPGITIAVRDPGSGFDPTSLPDPVQGGNLLQSRGRGIFLIRHLMDEVRFRRGGREIVMRKAFAATGRPQQR